MRLAAEIPAGSTDGTPTDGTPTDETPTDGTLTGKTLTDGKPTDGKPTDGKPIDADGTLNDDATEPGTPAGIIVGANDKASSDHTQDNADMLSAVLPRFAGFFVDNFARLVHTGSGITAVESTAKIAARKILSHLLQQLPT